MALRSPIVAVLGHVDHGKTSYLDLIRQTAVINKEPGMITQTISSTFVPRDVISVICGKLMAKYRYKSETPGLLFIDTPGHEAFMTMRERGGAIADLAVLVIDINEGIMPQTKESIRVLKEAKTPFIIALNKIDKIRNWVSKEKCYFPDSFAEQKEDVKGEFEKKFYDIVAQLNNNDVTAERYDRIDDFTKKIAIVPISAKTGEGVPDSLVILSALAERYLKDRLEKSDESKGTILEVKEVKGLGTTIDVIIYDGTVRKGDYLVIGSSVQPIITKIRALLEPKELTDMRTEKDFLRIQECTAAAGVKMVAPRLEKVIAGSPIQTTSTEEEAKKIMKKIDKPGVKIKQENEGLVLKADTIGSLEALVNIFKDYPILKAEIGDITKQDIIDAETNEDELLKVVIAFNVKGDSGKVKLFSSNVVYELLENYEKWRKKREKKMEELTLVEITRPGQIRLIPGLVFRASDPAVVGCEILAGVVKPGYLLVNENMEEIGKIKQLQDQGKDIDEAKIGDKVAVSITGVTIGRRVKESDVLYTNVSEDDYRVLEENRKFLSDSEKRLLLDIAEKQRKKKPSWGL
jgi:translation initiation factor 5B